MQNPLNWTSWAPYGLYGLKSCYFYWCYCCCPFCCFNDFVPSGAAVVATTTVAVSIAFAIVAATYSVTAFSSEGKPFRKGKLHFIRGYSKSQVKV
jgi:hypothetical protein